MKWAKVTVGGRLVGRCGPGFLVFAGAGVEDDAQRAANLADRVWGLRIFNDEAGKMNLALKDVSPQGEPNILAVSNFTLYGDTSQRRPSFSRAAPYERGRELFDLFVSELRTLGATVETGEFGADMQVETLNDGPVTLVIDT